MITSLIDADFFKISLATSSKHNLYKVAHIILEVINTELISLQTDDIYGVQVMAVVLLKDNDMENYLNGLNASEYEAVMRMKDTFHSRDDVKRFVNGLRG